MKTLSLLSNSSANASFRASRTVYSFPAGVAYVLVLVLGEIDIEAAGGKRDRTAGESGRCERIREPGRSSLEAPMVTYATPPPSSFSAEKSDREDV